MKRQIKPILQRGLGFHRYLVLHSIFVALTMRFRRNEGAVLEFISRLGRGANVLDIGANVGTMTLLFARRCRLGKVYAFEPIPENHRAAEAVLRLFRVSNASLFRVGLGERDETVTMVMPNAGPNVRLEGLSHVVRTSLAPSETGTFYKVRLKALDDIDELHDVRIAAIKIDVEDHERFVLRGGRKLISRDRPLIYCELWSDENKRECFSMLEELGYDAFVAGKGGLVPHDVDRHKQVNFFFVPRERRLDFGVETGHVADVGRTVQVRI